MTIPKEGKTLGSIMFKIVAVLLSVVNGSSALIVSDESYDTKEQCEDAMPGRMFQVQDILNKQEEQIIIVDANCVVQGEPA